jgi:NAD(P)-dependent dehydrogenase (short-subunit alcohol dehydrogenase family)
MYEWSCPMPETKGAVLITGAAGGVGTATTKALIDKGYRVYAGVHSGLGQLGSLPNVHVLKLDVTSPDSVAAAVAEVHEMGDSGLAAVVNNAGIIVQGPLELIPDDALSYQFEVNVLGAARVTRAFTPLLRARQGRLINITASTARLSVPFMGAVASSKAALASMSDALRLELAHWGIRVVVIEPGAMETEIFAKAGTFAEQVLQTQPPNKITLYRDQMAVMQKAGESMKYYSPTLVSDTVLKALTRDKPKARYTVGPDNRLLGLISRLPLSLRDALVARVTGLNKVPAAKS